jgi:hypothetical protein
VTYRNPLLLSSVILAACSGEHDLKSIEPEAGPEYHSSFEVLSPELGAWLIEGDSVLSGTSSDIDWITTAGTHTNPDDDGDFIEIVEVSQGITTIETLAMGLDEVDYIDRRSVIAGNFADPADPITDAFQLSVTSAGVSELGKCFSKDIAELEASVLLTAVNPIYRHR